MMVAYRRDVNCRMINGEAAGNLEEIYRSGGKL
jgi:hypothetical protein